MVKGANHPLLFCHHVQADIAKRISYECNAHPKLAFIYLIYANT